MRTVIIGSGNLASELSSALCRAGNPPLQIFSRNQAAGRLIAQRAGARWTDQPADLEQADIYIIAVSDRAIRQVASSLEFASGIVVHTAGSVPLEELPESIGRRGVMYPLQTFTAGRNIDFQPIPLLIEASDEGTLGEIRKFAEQLSGDVRECNSTNRMRLHIAAVFSSNFTNYMYTVGEILATEAGFDFSILKPLIGETASKALEVSTPLLSQTGPAIRNDFQTKSLHCEYLNDRPDLRNLYINLSNNIWETSKKTSQK